MPSKLEIAPPFDLDLTLRFDQGHRWRPDPEDCGWYTGVVRNQSVRIRQVATDGPVEVDSGTEEAVDVLLWQFRADEDIEAVHARDPAMKGLVNRYRGLRVMRVDPWECLVFFILSAHNHYQLQVATTPTAQAMDDIAGCFWKGERWPHDRYPFPCPDIVGSRGGLYKLRDLWGLGQDNSLPRMRGLRDMTRRLHEAARFVASDEFDQLTTKPTDEVITVLKRMPGVGAKTAHCVALFGLGRMDAFPNDAHVTRALLSLYGRDPFQPYAGYASQFLFMEGLTNPRR